MMIPPSSAVHAVKIAHHKVDKSLCLRRLRAVFSVPKKVLLFDYYTKFI